MIDFFQSEIIAVNPEILKLGLLFGEDLNATTDDLPEVLSFQHKLIQEMLAAYYIADQVTKKRQGRPKKGKTTKIPFLDTAFPTWECVEKHQEVVRFTCGLLAKTAIGAKPLIDHVAQLLACHIRAELNEPRKNTYSFKCLIESSLRLHDSFQKEGCLSEVNEYLCEYPACGRPLGEVLAKTKLAVISGLDIQNDDVINVNQWSADIILHLNREHMTEGCKKLWKALESSTGNLLGCIFDHCEMEKNEFEDMIKSIERMSSDPQLRLAYFDLKFIPSSLPAFLQKCRHLRTLTMEGLDPSSQISVFLRDMPESLRELILPSSRLSSEDVDLITDSVKNKKLPQLKVLDISQNPVGKRAVRSLLEAFHYLAMNEGRYIGSDEKHDTSNKIEIHLYNTDIHEEFDEEDEHDVADNLPDDECDTSDEEDEDDDDGVTKDLPDDFIKEWKEKLAGTNIEIHWKLEYN